MPRQGARYPAFGPRPAGGAAVRFPLPARRRIVEPR